MVARAECSTPLGGQEIGEVEALEPWAVVMSQLATGDHKEAHNTRNLVAKVAMTWMRCIPVVGDVIESVLDTAVLVKGEMHKDPVGKDSPAMAATQGQIFQQYINVLDGLARETPLVLMLDDFHWADASSANLLFTAARELHQRPLLFIVAYRPDDARSARNGEGHALLHVRGELERYSMASEIGVPGMTPDDLDLLLRDRYPNYQNSDPFEEWLAAVSDGNALFITQFLKTLEEDGVVDRAKGAIIGNYHEAHIPQSISAVLGERIRRMSEETRELLRYASVEGDIFTSAVLARVTEVPQLKLLQKLRLIEQTHQAVKALGKQRVYAEETTAYRFVHALMHKLMYESLGDEERELLHEMIFTVLKEEWEKAEQSGVNLPGMAVRMAVHADVLHEYQYGAEMLWKGATASWREYAEQETMRLLDGLVVMVEKARQQGTSDIHKLTAIEAKGYILRGDIHMVRGRHHQRMEDYQRACRLLEGTDNEELAIDAINREATALHWAGDVLRTEERAREAMARAEKIGYTKGVFDATNALGNLQALHGISPELLDWRLRAIEAARRVGENGIEEAGALNNAGIVYHYLGEYAASEACFLDSLAICVAINDRLDHASVLNNLASLYLNTERDSEAGKYLEECRDICRSIGNEWTEAYALHNLAILQERAGDLDEALKNYQRVVAIAEKNSDQSLRAGALRNIGGIYYEQRDYITSMRFQTESLGIYEGLDNPDEIAYTCIAIARLQIDIGALQTAAEYCERALRLAREHDLVDREAEALEVTSLINERASEGAKRDTSN